MKIAIAAFSLIIAAAPAIAGRAEEDALLAAAARDFANGPSMEADALAASHGRAVRQGEVLTLALTRAAPVTLKSNPAACANDDVANCERFTLVADLKLRHAYLVAKSGYEGCADLLLIDDRSGRQTTFGAAPVFSPDSQRLLIQNECEADDHDNHFEIWRRRGDGWALEWAYTDKQAYAADPILEGPYHTEVTAWVGSRVTLAFSTREGSRDHGRAWTGTLEHDSEGWKLLASPPPSK